MAEDRLRAELDQAREALKQFEHVEGEPLSETAAVAACAYDFLRHSRDTLGHALERERAKPGGSYDVAAYLQVCQLSDAAVARVAQLEKALLRFCLTMEWVDGTLVYVPKQGVADALAASAEPAAETSARSVYESLPGVPDSAVEPGDYIG